MLIRFVVDNVYSFGEECEFNMLPQPRLRSLDHHKYHVGGLDLVKMGAIYGPNGAGKSNLVKAIALLQEIVLGGSIRQLEKVKFKFEGAEKRKQFLGVEFVQDTIPFGYYIETLNGVIVKEALYVAGLDKKEDENIFERTLDEHGVTHLKFPPNPEREERNAVFIEILLESYVRQDQAILRLLAETEKGKIGNMAQVALNWFMHSLTIMTTETKATGLPQFLDQDPAYKKYANAFISSFDLGITEIGVKKQPLKEFLGNSHANEADLIFVTVDNAPNQTVQKHSDEVGPVVFVKEGSSVVAKTLQLTHEAFLDRFERFDMGEESEGTARLIDFIPVMKALADEQKVFIIDEIERSLHPILIKGVLQKFSQDTSSQGQLIFTTHELNLLDQEMIRLDEIWLAEKDKLACTEFYPLCDFKIHNTIDIKKGYLQGRFGAVPYLGNLQNLNWHFHA